MPKTGDVTCAGVDWITATGRLGQASKALVEVGDRCLALEECTGATTDYRRNRNYDLVVCGDVSIGHRAEDVMVELVGEFARAHWREVAQNASNISRLDLQTTVRFTPPDPDVVADHYLTAHRRNLRLKRPVALKAELDQLEHRVMWINAPHSIQRGRIYDKSRGGKEAAWRDCWRYEVQYRDELAGDVARELLMRENEPQSVAASVSEYFARRGVNVRYDTDGVPIWAPLKRKESTRERKLRWLREQVMLTLDLAHREGWGIEAYEALGVPHDLAVATVARRHALRGDRADGGLLYADVAGG